MVEKKSIVLILMGEHPNTQISSWKMTRKIILTFATKITYHQIIKYYSFMVLILVFELTTPSQN